MESQLVIAYSSRNIVFTVVGTTDMAEGTDKLISGECDALAGVRTSMIVKKNALDSDMSINGGTWRLRTYVRRCAMHPLWCRSCSTS